MEEKLFWIGIGMGAYSLLLKHAMQNKRWHTPGWTAALHAVFCGGAAFVGTLIVLMSLASRADLHASPGVLTPRTLYPSLFALAAGLAWGVWNGRKAKKDEARQGILSEDLEWADTVFSAVLLASFLMYFVLQAFKIPSGSMRNTLLEGDHLFVNKFLYGVRVPMTSTRLLRLRPVERGDIVVFEFPSRDPEETHCGSPQAGKDFIKRAVAVAGDVVEVREGLLYLNGKPAGKEDYALYDSMRLPPPQRTLPPEQYQRAWQERRLDKEVGDLIRDNFGPVTVPPGSYFVMGDNRDHSCDARFWGPVPDRFLKGKAWFLYWPPGRMRVIQ